MALLRPSALVGVSVLSPEAVCGILSLLICNAGGRLTDSHGSTLSTIFQVLLSSAALRRVTELPRGFGVFLLSYGLIIPYICLFVNSFFKVFKIFFAPGPVSVC